MEQVLDEVPKDVDVVIVTGAGGNAFVAGVDINDLSRLNERNGNRTSEKRATHFLKTGRFRAADYCRH